MKRTITLIIITAAAMLLAGCGGDATAPEPQLGAEDFVGEWTLSIQAAPGCWSASTLWFRIDDDLTSSTGDFMNVVNDWTWTEDFSATRPLIGNIRYRDGTFELNLWKQAPTVGGKFSGTNVSAGRLSGTFRDMGRAFSINSPCDAPATASRR